MTRFLCFPEIPPHKSILIPAFLITRDALSWQPANRRFIVGLDPTFFYLKDPELYLLWYKICREAPAGSAEIIRRRFGAR